MNATNFIKRNSKKLFAFNLLFVLLLPLTAQVLLWGWSTAGAISSLSSAALVALLASISPPLIIAIVLIFWSVLQSASLELVLAVGRMPSLTDAVYLFNKNLIHNSIEGNGLTHPLFLLAMLVGSVIVIGLRTFNGPIPQFRQLRNICLAVLILSPLHIFVRQFHMEDPPWKQYDIFHKLVAETARQNIFSESGAHAAWSSAKAETLTSLDLEGERLINSGKARNLLLVVLEGISGADIDQIREAQGYQSDKQPMPRLSALGRDYDAMHVPDFVVHNHQTIRGLYSLLCGDYPKLNFSTPKATELLALDEVHQSCLPSQLARNGFSTHFLQAADLSFMSKDKAMPRMGFQTTLGRESITPSPGQGEAIVWGWDDKAFFSGSLQAIQKLEKKNEPWFLTLLTVGTHQPYGAPQSYLDRYPSPMLAAIAYLDEAVSHFLTQLKETGVLDHTLVIVTSDEAHGNVLRLGSAWGLSMVLAPEHKELPLLKKGVYGHVDLAASALDYFGFPMAPGIAGRSIFRDYEKGREILSYTNGFHRHLNGNGNLEECDFQKSCREYAHNYSFIVPQAVEIRRFSDEEAKKQFTLAEVLNRSILRPETEQSFLFADGDRRQLKQTVMNEWIDNLIGAQYLDFGKGTRTSVNLSIKAIHTDSKGAALSLRFKEYDQDSSVEPPVLPLLHSGEELTISFDIDNQEGRRAFSFHLLGEGQGEIAINEFRVSTRRIDAIAESNSQNAALFTRNEERTAPL